MRIEREVALHDTHLDGGHVLGALRHDDAVSAVASRGRLTQIACGEQGILVQLAASIDQKDAEGRVHVAVLEAIVQQYHLGALGLGQGHQVAHRPAAVAVDD